MPARERQALLSQLKPVAMPVNTPLYEPDEQPQYFHFLTSGIASIVTSMEDGATTEVGTVGREGAPQGVHLLGSASVATRCFMQVAGTGLRMDYKLLADMFEEEPQIRRPLLAYAQYQTVLLGQIAGCNRLHAAEARLARWLLMVQVRTGSSVLKLTQEFLAQMMGSRRTTVSAVAGALQGRGLIDYARGNVKILKRTELENAACECYPTTRKLLRGLYSLAGQSVVTDKAD